MRSLMVALLVFFASPAAAADEMTIAVFTKNSTNPAYEAFRIASDQIARSTGAKSSISSRIGLTTSKNKRRWWNRC